MIRPQLFVAKDAMQDCISHQIPFILCEDGRLGLFAPSEFRVATLMGLGYDVFRKNGEKCVPRPSKKTQI